MAAIPPNIPVDGPPFPYIFINFLSVYTEIYTRIVLCSKLYLHEMINTKLNSYTGNTILCGNLRWKTAETYFELLHESRPQGNGHTDIYVKRVFI